MEKLTKLRMWALRRSWVLALLLFPFFKPEMLVKQSLALAWVFVIWKSFSVLFIGLLWLSWRRMSKVTVLLSVYYVLMLASSILSRMDAYNMLFLTGNVIALGMCLDMCVEEDARAILRGLVWLLGALCLVNLVTVVLFMAQHRPSNYFLGYDNSHSLFIIPLLGLGMVYAHHAGWGVWRKLAVLAVFSVSIYMTWSASAVVGVTVFLLLAAAYEMGFRLRVCNVAVYFAVFLALFFGIVVFRAQRVLAYVIEDILGKDLTFTGRTDLWDASIELIRQRPVLGYGLIPRDLMTELVGSVNCHDLVFQVLADAGFVGLAVYGTMMGLLVKPLMAEREHYVGYYLAASLFALLLVFTMESPVYPLPHYTICILSYHAPALVRRLDSAAAPPA